MDIFDVLTLIGGLCLFLFGMNLMGDALERSAGSKLEIMIGKLTTGKLAGLLTGPWLYRRRFKRHLQRLWRSHRHENRSRRSDRIR